MDWIEEGLAGQCRGLDVLDPGGIRRRDRPEDARRFVSFGLILELVKSKAQGLEAERETDPAEDLEDRFDR